METLKGVIKDLQNAFGGEVWVDGVLCYKDHEKVANPFPLKPLPGGFAAEKGGVREEDLDDFVPLAQRNGRLFKLSRLLRTR